MNGFKIKILRYVGFIFVFFLGFLSIVGSGPRYAWRYDPIPKPILNDIFTATIVPTDNNEIFGGWNAFILSVTNKTNKNIEIVWDKTLFVSNGRTSGGFMFEGVVYRERNSPKPNDIVFANSTFTKTIWPNNLVEFIGKSWYNHAMRPGENGIYLTLKVGNEEVSEKMTVNMIMEKISK